jgi:hypothetical protein
MCDRAVDLGSVRSHTEGSRARGGASRRIMALHTRESVGLRRIRSHGGMISGSIARGRVGLERHQWIVEGALSYPSACLCNTRASVRLFRSHCAALLPEPFLSIKEWPSPLLPEAEGDLGNGRIEEVALHWAIWPRWVANIDSRGKGQDCPISRLG